MGGKVAQLVRHVALQRTQLHVLQVSLLVVVHVARTAQAVVQFHAHIAAAMLGKHDVTVAVDVLGVVEAQFHHCRNHVFQAVGADERATLGDLLDGQERGVGVVGIILSLVMALDHAQKFVFGLSHGDVFFLLDNALQLMERVDGDDVPSLLQHLLDLLQVVCHRLCPAQQTGC